MSEDPPEPECPLCMEIFQLEDLSFYPCTCGYQICQFCWHRIRETENGMCPACRKPYAEDPAHFEPVTNDEINNRKKEKKLKEAAEKQKIIDSRKQFSDLRVIQKNLMFVFGLPNSVTDPEVLKKQEHFGKFGKIQKITLTKQANGLMNNNHQLQNQSAYITFSRVEDTLRAIRSVNSLTTYGKSVKASLGTTKYCSRFLRGMPCLRQDCMYLHETVEEEASFTKEEIQQGKHTSYEQKLYNQFCSSVETSAPSSAASTAAASTTTTTATSAAASSTATSAATVNGDLRVSSNSGDGRGYNKVVGSFPKNSNDDRKLQNNTSKTNNNNKPAPSTPKKIGKDTRSTSTNHKVSCDGTPHKNNSGTNLTPKSNRSKRKSTTQPGVSKNSINSLFSSVTEKDATVREESTGENVGDVRIEVGPAATDVRKNASVENLILDGEKEKSLEKKKIDVCEPPRSVASDDAEVADGNETNEISLRHEASRCLETLTSDLDTEVDSEVKETEIIDFIGNGEEGSDDDDDKSKHNVDSSQEDDIRKSFSSTNDDSNISHPSKNSPDENDVDRSDNRRSEPHDAVTNNNEGCDAVTTDAIFKMDPMMREMLDNLDSSVLDGGCDNNNLASSSGTDDDVESEDHRDDELGFDPWYLSQLGLAEMLEKEKQSKLTGRKFSEDDFQDEIQKERQQHQLKMKEIYQQPQQEKQEIFNHLFGEGWEMRTSSTTSSRYIPGIQIESVDSFGCNDGLNNMEAHRNSFHQPPNPGFPPNVAPQPIYHHVPYPFPSYDGYGSRARMSGAVAASQDLHNQSYPHDTFHNQLYRQQYQHVIQQQINQQLNQHHQQQLNQLQQHQQLQQQQLHQQQLQQEQVRYLNQQQLLSQQQVIARQKQMLDQQQYMQQQQQSVSEQKKWQDGLKALLPNVNISFGPRPPFVKVDDPASVAPPSFSLPNDHVAYQNAHPGAQFPREDLHRGMGYPHEVSCFDPAIVNAGGVAARPDQPRPFKMPLFGLTNQGFPGQRSSSYRPPYAEDHSQSNFVTSGPVANWQNHAQESSNAQTANSLQPNQLPSTTTTTTTATSSSAPKRTVVIQPPPGFENVRPPRGDFV